MPRVLLVEDEEHLAAGIRFNLELDGYEVETIADGLRALERLLPPPEGDPPAPPVDLVVLDVMLPGLDGFQIAERMRKAGDYTPILMLTAKGLPEDMVEGLQAGADDYLPKPFDLPVLLARVKSLIRRRDWARGVSGDPVKVGPALVDFANFELRKGDELVRLTLLEATLLKLLVERRGQVVSKAEILEKVWNLNPDTETRAVDNFVMRLRRHLEEDARSPRLLVTVRGVGYRLATLLLAASAVVSGCGGGGAGPGAPRALAPVASGLDFTLVPQLEGASEAEFRWSGSDATSYRLEVGTSPGASDAASLEAGAATELTWRRIPIGTFYARVRPLQGASVGSPSNEVLVGSIDARPMIDALVFGYGPLAVAGNAGRSLNSGIWEDRVLGWQPGSGFAVVLGASVPPEPAAAAERTVQQIGPATRGTVAAGLAERRPDPLAFPAPGEVTISYYADTATLKAQCSCDACVGCARTYYSGSFAFRSQILFGSAARAATVPHELGHVIGLAHVISAAGVRPPFTMGVTTDGRFSPDDRIDALDPASVRMLETIYGAGFTAGTHRRLFEAAGFVLPEYPTAAARPAPEQRPAPRVEEQRGLETMVLKPFCQ